MKYKLVPVLENLFKSFNEKDRFTSKIQVDWFDSDHSIGQDNHFNNTEDDCQIWSKKVDNSKDKSHNKLGIPKKIYKSKPVDRQNKINKKVNHRWIELQATR